MKNHLSAALLAIATVVPGSAWSATLIQNIDISAGEFVTVSEMLLPGGSAEFRYTALTDLLVGEISLSGVGDTTADIGIVEFALTLPTLNTFSTILDCDPDTVSGSGETVCGLASLPGRELFAGETFTIYWDDGVISPVRINASFSTFELTPIPLPAGLPLLAAGLGLLGLIQFKRQAGQS